MENQTPTPAQRRTRVSRARANELQKIELFIEDTKDLEINTRIFNKLKNKIRR